MNDERVYDDYCLKDLVNNISVEISLIKIKECTIM